MRLQKILSIVIILLFGGLANVSYSQALSEKAEISLLTMSAGADLYSKFGHSAIRIVDPKLRIDQVYNYGIFDFDEPNFYVKFVRGKLKYKLGVQPYRQVIQAYRYYKRNLVEQKFNLNPAQKQQVFDFLTTNYRPENRYYLYDFFYDNCATRIRDVIDSVLVDKISYEIDSLEKNKTFRQLLDEYIGDLLWTDFGMDLILGLPADDIANYQHQMFLPDYLQLGFEFARVQDSTARNLLQAEKMPVVQVYQPKVESPFWTSPVTIFWGLLGLTFLLIVVLKRHWINKWLHFLIFMATGLAGCLMLFMWLGTDHHATTHNLNLLWANPLHLLTAFDVFRTKIPSRSRRFFFITGIINVLILLFWSSFPQQLHDATLPIVVLLAFLLGWYWQTKE